MRRGKRWKIAESDPGASELAARLGTSPLLAQVLLNRGLREAPQCREFLSPSLMSLPDPSLLAGLPRAAERIARAIKDKQKIVIYGDYDVDGITACAILWHALKILGGEVDYYIPHRIEEGYGLNSEAIGQICDDGARLIITVDCGITAVREAQTARDRGVDLIVTDHHQWLAEDGTPRLPDCHAIVHPRLAAEGAPAYPNPHLCGAGVAFKLAWGLGQALNGADRVSQGFREFLVEATALAALGTIADVVPLLGENRVLAHYGLCGLEKSKLLGIRALIDSAGLSGQAMDSYHVGFCLAPRLNACGRMGHARLAVEMLTKAGEAQAREIAAYLEQQNRAGQTLERKILLAAMEQVSEQHLDDEACAAVVLGSVGWHPGVIGIVASRIVDRLHRPTIMVALSDGVGQGSGRSIAGFHLTDALHDCREYLTAYGGHEMAAGLKMEAAKFEDFRRAFGACAGRTVTAAMRQPELALECAADLKQITSALVKDLGRLGPFGHGNRRPVLACRGLELAAPARRVGKNADHLQLMVRQDGASMKCIAFGFGEMAEQLRTGTKLDVAAEATLNAFNGWVNVELEVKDLRIV